MTDKLIKLLKESKADAWEITDKKISGWEFFFIRHLLDQNRAKDVEHITIKVYKKSDDGESIGVAEADISPTETEDSVRKMIDDLIYQASLVKNKYYRLNTPTDDKPETKKQISVSAESKKFIETMRDIPETDTEFLNSYELFTKRVEKRFVNSEGIDVSEVYPESMVEVVLNAKDDTKEVELYRLYDCGTCNSDVLSRDIIDSMRFTKDRLNTVPTPALGSYPVILSTSAAASIYEFFLYNMTASYVFRKISSFEIGKPIEESVSGDTVTLEALQNLEGSSENFAYDEEGARIHDLVLIKDGIPQHYWGGRMFSQYLGLDDSFIVYNWKVTGGTLSAEEIRSGNYLEVVEFSDFQVDELTGDMFGEIRLAYWHCDGKTVPVSGGSISGNFKDNIGSLHMSRELRQYDNKLIPSVTRLENMSIAGTEGE